MSDGCKTLIPTKTVLACKTFKRYTPSFAL
jgi:hypothetical protein